MRILSVISFFSLTILLTGCSWNEYFVIVNRTGSDILVEYQLDEPVDALDIFVTAPDVYRADDKDEIDWDIEKIDSEDSEPDISKVSLVLKNGTLLRFGILRNDHYEFSGQDFINDTDFNLKDLKIISQRDTIMIDKHSFDEFFQKENGFIKIILK